MKTIIYILIAIILSSILISSLPIQNKKESNLITLQCVNKIADPILLKKSALIFEYRLKEISSEEFNIKINSQKNQIQILLPNNWNINFIKSLLTQKGELGFYETYTQDSLLKLLNGEKQLFSLLNEVVSNNQKSEIGCVKTAELSKVNHYLSTVGLSNKCKFAWNISTENSEVCLYALKLDPEKGSVINNSNIEMMKIIQDNNTENFSIEIELKESSIELWSKITRRNINKSIAIILDNKVIYAPILKSEINSGKCSITGDFTISQVRYLIALGNNEILPLDFEMLN